MGTPAKQADEGPLTAAISTVATSQICRAAGYAAAEPAALRALSDITCRYISSIALAAAAAARAGSSGRTEANLLDLTRALEEHAEAAAGGFAGASDPARPPLRSGALTELAEFVGAVREVPFAKPIPRRGRGVVGAGWESFAAAGREPPLRHVPRWLPCFPETWEGWKRGEEKEKEQAMVVVGKREEERRQAVVGMPENRGKVRFRVVAGEKKRRRLELTGELE